MIPPEPELSACGESGLADFASYYRDAFDMARSAVQMAIMMVGPERAVEWLEKNGINRPPSLKTVSRYAYYMTRGTWRFKGEPIILGGDGTLLDGQHRLMAVRKAGIAVPMLVVSGVDKEAFKTLDQGKLRSAGDTLATAGEKRAKCISGALFWLHRYESGAMCGQMPRLSNEEVIDLLKEFPGVRESAEYIFPRVLRGVHQPGPFTFLHFACLRKHPDRSEFFEQVMSGANLVTDSPAHLLYRRLTGTKEYGGRTKFQTLWMMAITVKAWNAHVAGKRPGVLKWSRESGFPEIL